MAAVETKEAGSEKCFVGKINRWIQYVEWREEKKCRNTSRFVNVGAFTERWRLGDIWISLTPQRYWGQKYKHGSGRDHPGRREAAPLSGDTAESQGWTMEETVASWWSIQWTRAGTRETQEERSPRKPGELMNRHTTKITGALDKSYLCDGLEARIEWGLGDWGPEGRCKGKVWTVLSRCLAVNVNREMGW